MTAQPNTETDLVVIGVETLLVPTPENASACPPGNHIGLGLLALLLENALRHAGIDTAENPYFGEINRGAMVFVVESEKACDVIRAAFDRIPEELRYRLAIFDPRELIWRLVYPPQSDTFAPWCEALARWGERIAREEEKEP